MKTKKSVLFIMIMAFLVFVGILPTVCAFIPYRDAYFSEDTTILQVDEDEDGVEDAAYFVGDIVNPTICTISNVDILIHYTDASGKYVGRSQIKINEEIAGGSTYTIFNEVFFPATAAAWEVVGATYEVKVMSAWMYYGIGVIIYAVFSLLFMKKKGRFNVGNHTVEVYAGMQKATLVVDGSVVKTMECKIRGQVENCDVVIDEKVVSLQFQMGTFTPNMEVRVDGEMPKFVSYKQHVFLSNPAKKAKGNQKEVKEEKKQQSSVLDTEKQNNKVQSIAVEKTVPAVKTTQSAVQAQAPVQEQAKRTLQVTKEQKEKILKAQQLYKDGIISMQEYKTIRDEILKK